METWIYVIDSYGRVLGVYGRALGEMAQARAQKIPFARVVQANGPRVSVGGYLTEGD